MVYVASFDHNVYALDAITGAKIWNFSTGKQIYSSPAVVNGIIYFASYSGIVYAVGQPTSNNFYYVVAAAIAVAVIIIGAVVFLIKWRR